VSERKPTLVVVTGPAGSGKTTLAHALALAIPCPAVCRDELKEGMVHAHGGGFEPDAGDLLTDRTYPLFFDVLRVLLEGGVTVVAEAAFQDRLWRQGLEPLLELADLRVVNCRIVPELAHGRGVARGPRAAHVPLQRPATSFEWLSLPAPSLDVDTTDGYDPPVAAIVAFVDEVVSSGA
jgi:predicted kinase